MKKPAALTIAALTLLSAIGSPALAQPAAPETAPAKQTPARTVEEAPKVKLLDPGAEPRKALRYAPAVGDRHIFTITMSMDQKAEMGGNPVPIPQSPPMMMVFDLNITEVRADGNVKYAMLMTKVDVDTKEETPQVQAMRESLKGIVGMSGTAVVTNRGETIEAEFKLPPGADPMMAAMMDSMKSSARQMSAPLPEEAVGKGAKWEVAMKVKTGGMTLDQTATMTLDEVTDDDFKLGMELVQKAGPQMVDGPMGKVEIVDITSKGKGTLAGSTRKIVPTKSEMMTNSVQEMKIGDQALKMDMKIGMKMASEPAKEEKK